MRLVTDVSPYGPVLPTRSGRSSHANDPLQGLIWTRDNLYNGPRDGLWIIRASLRAFFTQVGGSSIYDDVVYEGQSIEMGHAL